MDGTNQAVGQSEPRIAAFLANPQPASQQAARAMAVGTTAQTNGFLNGQRAALTASAGSINGGVLGGLASILNGINQMMGAGQPQTQPPGTTTPATTLPALTLPNTTLPTVSPTTTSPTVTGLPTADQTYPYGYPTPATASGHVVHVAFNSDGSLASVQSDIPVDVRVDEMTAGGQHLVKDIKVNANGSTTTTTT
jgi:hypothetical protein